MMLKFVLVLIVFVDGNPVIGKVWGFPDEAKCKTAETELIANAKEAEADIFTKCYPVDHKPAKAKPQKPTRGANS